MRVAIITSEVDLASKNIRNHLLKKLKFHELNEKINGYPIFITKYYDKELLLATIKSDLIYADYVDKLEADILIFASRHESQSGYPMFSAHTPGNWTEEALYGGKPNKVCIAPALLLTKLVKTLMKVAYNKGFSDWRCGFEVTHHGPYIENKPVVFIEIGSKKEHWVNNRAGEVIAETLLEVLKGELKASYAGIGIGGPHYAPKFNKFIQKSEIPLGHIIPNYVLDKINEEILKMGIERTWEPVKYAILDWKGIKKEQKKWIIPCIKELGLEIIRA